MKIEIHSIESIEKRGNLPFTPHTSLISIRDSDAPPPKLKYKPEHVLRLVFDDITLDEVRDEARERLDLLDDEKLIELLADYGIHIIDDHQAERIAEFIHKYIDITDVLIGQCHYGESRSAGCAAAIAEYFYGAGITIFSDDRYYPNKLVYHKVLEALRNYERQDLKMIKISEAIKQSFDRLDSSKNPEPVLTGFDGLDKLTTGFHKDALILLGARPGMGKTSFALTIARHLALVKNKRIAFFRSTFYRKNWLS